MAALRRCAVRDPSLRKTPRARQQITEEEKKTREATQRAWTELPSGANTSTSRSAWHETLFGSVICALFYTSHTQLVSRVSVAKSHSLSRS